MKIGQGCMDIAGEWKLIASKVPNLDVAEFKNLVLVVSPCQMIRNSIFLNFGIIQQQDMVYIENQRRIELRYENNLPETSMQTQTMVLRCEIANKQSCTAVSQRPCFVGFVLTIVPQ